MCLIVNKKYEKNNEKRTVYKVFLKSYIGGKLLTLYQKVEVTEGLEAEGEPQFCMYGLEKSFGDRNMKAYVGREILEGGAIHTFTNLEDAMKIVRGRLEYYKYCGILHFYRAVAYEVEGTGVVAEGIFPVVFYGDSIITEVESVCFESIKLVRELECV